MCQNQTNLPALLADSLAAKGGALKDGDRNISVTFLGFDSVSHVGGTPQ
jgi:hypothetical protein